MRSNGRYLASRLREITLPFITAYGDFLVREVLGRFSDLSEKANQVADSELERRSSLSASDALDTSDVAEQAFDASVVFHQTMTDLRQTVLNLFSAGLFHLVEQQLADLTRDGLFREMPDLADTKLMLIVAWYRANLGINLESLPSWRAIDDLRLIANVAKHAEGSSARLLRERHPELLTNPVSTGLLPTWNTPNRVALPLAGDDLFVTDAVFGAYCASAKHFFDEIAAEVEKD